MPKFQDYPLVTTIANDDKFMMHQATSAAEKLIKFSDLIPSFNVDSLADLKAFNITKVEDGDIVNMLGYYTPGDGGGGSFMFQTAINSVANDGTVVYPTSGGGNWLRLTDGSPDQITATNKKQATVSVLWFGARGDGVTDDSAVILKAMLGAGEDGTLVFPSGFTYAVASQITIPNNNLTILGYGATINSSVANTQYRKFLFSGRSRGAIKGFNFSIGASGAAVGLEAGCIEIIDSEKIVIQDCYFSNTAKTGVRIIGNSSYCHIDNNWFKLNFCSIVTDDDTVSQPTNLVISNNTVVVGLSASTVAFSGGIKMSGIGSASSIAGHVISGNIINTPGEVGIEIQGWVNDSTILGNTVNGGMFGISVSFCARVSVTGNTVTNPTHYGLESADSSFVAFAGNVVHTSYATCRTLSTSTSSGASTDVSVSGGLLKGGSHSAYLHNTQRISITGVQMYGAVEEVVYLHDSSYVDITGCTLSPSNTCYSIVMMDSTDFDVQFVNITGNIFQGVAGRGITLYAPANHIQDVSVSGNNTAGMTCANGGWFSGGTVAPITRLLRIRSFGNIGVPDDITKTFSFGVWATSSSLAVHYDYPVFEGSTVSYDCTGGNKTFELPKPTGMSGWSMTLTKSDSSANILTVSAYGGAPIRGATTFLIYTFGQMARFTTDGANWFVENCLPGDLSTKVQVDADFSVSTASETCVIWESAPVNVANAWIAATPHILYVPDGSRAVQIAMETRWLTDGAVDNLGSRKIRIKTYGTVGEIWGVDMRTAVGCDQADSTVCSPMLTKAGITAREGAFVAWAPATAYPLAIPSNVTIGMARYNGDDYICISAHTSGASFDPTKWKKAPAFYVTVTQTSGATAKLRAASTKFAIQSFE